MFIALSTNYYPRSQSFDVNKYTFFLPEMKASFLSSHHALLYYVLAYSTPVLRLYYVTMTYAFSMLSKTLSLCT